MKRNIDQETVESFGDEWHRFNQRQLDDNELSPIFEDYFAIFPWPELPEGAVGFDMGCGAGRWAKFVAPRVGHLSCIDPSSAIEVARENLAACTNVSFHKASVGDDTLPANSQDFGYSLGVLHHVPNTAAALRACANPLKNGAPFLVYLYYSFENRSTAFRLLWRCSDSLRRVISRMPSSLKHGLTDVLALAVYWPLARISRLLEMLGVDVNGLPLSYYRRRSFYTMRTDSRDRFGTPLEQRFSRIEIEAMMVSAGFADIRFSDRPPYWCAVGIKR